jgi:hypothetical protein
MRRNEFDGVLDPQLIKHLMQTAQAIRRDICSALVRPDGVDP